MKLVILAGGYGTRISEETKIKPKPFKFPFFFYYNEFYINRRSFEEKIWKGCG